MSKKLIRKALEMIKALADGVEPEDEEIDEGESGSEREASDSEHEENEDEK